MRYLHTMIRVGDIDRSLRFYCEGLGFHEVSRKEYPEGKFTLIFLQSEDGGPQSPQLELTYNWGVSSYERGTGYGHVAYHVDSIASVQGRLEKSGYKLSWGPGRTPDGKRGMAFVDDPDGYKIELLEG